MDADRWSRIEECYHAALDRPPAQRAEFVARLCAHDPELRREVESLLAHEGEADALLESPVWHQVASMDATMTLAPSAFAAGTTVGQYRIVGKLGEGGMGVVYRAQDLKLGRGVALKFPTESMFRRFEREARAAAALNHPHICTIYGLEDLGGRPAIVMEFLEGETLAARLAKSPLPLDQSLALAIQIAEALVEAHRCGVVHRDLKPANIMLTRSGAKVLDFGLAKMESAVGEPRGDATVTGKGTILGTPNYMSPEQARGFDVDARTDIFSLGVTLYEMAAGRRPFEGGTVSDTLAALLEKQAPPLARYLPQAPDELQRIIDKALEKNREERYQSAKDLQLDLEKLKRTIARSTPGGTTPGGAPAARIVRRYGRPAMALLALAGASIAVFAYLRHTPALTDKDAILLADFVNTTGDPVFDDTLKQGLAAQLEQSPFLDILPEETVRETLGFMGRSPDERVTNAIGRQICQRQGVKALIEGSIAALGSHYVLTLAAVNAATGADIARVQSEAEAKERVLRALGGSAAELRRKLGESLSSVRKYDAPMVATTASLEALQAYSLGMRSTLALDTRRAVPYLKRAIELDPTFAEAFRALANAYFNQGQHGQEMIEAARKA